MRLYECIYVSIHQNKMYKNIFFKYRVYEYEYVSLFHFRKINYCLKVNYVFLAFLSFISNIIHFWCTQSHITVIIFTVFLTIIAIIITFVCSISPCALCVSVFTLNLKCKYTFQST